MKIFLASKNRKKLEEMQRILAPLGIEVLSEINSDYTIEDVEETGTTFEENAYIKAYSAYKCTGLPSLADDSGLCVDALDGQPGVYSARFAGEPCDDAKNNQKLLNLLKDVPSEKRSAKFVCNICCVINENEVINAYGECKGKIATSLCGQNNFGYDPLFLCGDKSFAQMTAEEKDSVSHRNNALKDFIEKLKTYKGENNDNK